MDYPQTYLKYIATLPYSPSAEQVAIVDACLSSKSNLLISALAGAAKTSTLKLIAYALPETNMMCLAFNKAIADEMAAELPSNCEARTLNSLGHRVWGTYLKKKLTLKKNKMFDVISEIIEKDYSLQEREEISAEFSFILKACNHAKAAGHLPDRFYNQLPANKVSRILSDDDLIDSLEEFLPPLITEVILKSLMRSAMLSMEGQIDFGDQILFPSLFKCMYPIYSLILVDEAQDLSPLNHLMLQQLYRRRIIAVGDQNQAIYAFRGAHAKGMQAMQQLFDMVPMSLTTTFRCPEKIVEHVLWKTPHMKAFKPGGEVLMLNAWDERNLPEYCAILCRNNAPLFSTAVNLLKAGRYPKLWGNDIAAGLLKIMKDLGTERMDQKSALSQLVEWREKRLKRVKNKSLVYDQFQCIKVFLDENPTLGDAIAYAEHVFKSSGKIDLLTCHKSKGHEFDIVFILDEHLMSEEEQDSNLRYVACTRAKQKLTYIRSDNWIGE